MSEEAVRKALEARLAAMSPALSTAWENVAFTPVTGQPYQKATMLYAEPEDVVLSARMRTVQGYLHVLLLYPQGVGSGAAQARADAVVEWFPKGSTYTQDGVQVHISASPKKAPGFTDPADGRYCVPVSVPYKADIFQ